MRLYTEEQMNEAFTNGFLTAMNYDGGCNDHFNEYIKTTNPLELPTNEQIEIAMDYPKHDAYSFRDGAKWVIDKIKNQQ